MVLASAPEAALWGPSPVTRASGRCLDVVRVLRITGGAPAVEAVALRCQAVLEALRGRLDAARTMVAAARRTFEELGLAPHLLETDVAAGQIELVHGQPVEAEAHLRPALDALRDRGLDGETARAAALLGRALLAQGRVDEAEALGQEAATLAGADLRAGVGWRTILAVVAAAREDRTEALRLAVEAVELSSATDALLLEVEARMTLAEVLRAVGDDDAATAETRRAIDLCERKGATALADLAAQRLPDTTPPPAADGSVTGGARLDGRRRPVRENLATASAHRFATLLNSGDIAGFIEMGSASTIHVYEVGELTPEQTLEYLSGSPEEPLATTVTPLATLGERHLLYHGTFDTSDTVRPEPWGDSRMENVTVYEVERDGRPGPAWLFPVTHVGQAVVALYERFAESEAQPGPEQERALMAARAVAQWCAANDHVAIEDVVELDLDHVVLVGREGDQPRDVVLQLGGWERFTRPFPERSFEDALREHDLDPTTTAITLIATRNECLALAEAASSDPREGPGLLGLVVHEIDTQDHRVRSEWFDPGDLDAAYATLDDWYVAANEPASGRRLVGLDLYHDPDRAAFDTYFAPGLVVEDHRVVGHVFSTSRDAFFELVTGLRIGMVEIGLRNRHVLGCDRGALAVVDQEGAFAVDASSHPAPFDLSVVSVEEVDDAGRVVRVDLYDEDQLGDALARYDGLATTAARPTRPPGWERFERLRPPDPDQLATSLTPEVRIEDHRTLVGVAADGIADVLDRWDQMQQDTSLRVSTDLLATRGEHFALSEIHLDGTWGLSGDVEQSFLSLGEVDDDLKTVRLAFFDVEDRDRAFAALDEWYLAGRELSWLSMLSSTSYYGANVLDQAWTYLAPDVVLEDHRLVGLETVRGRDSVTDFLGRMRQTLSRADVRTFHVLEHEQAGLYVASISGALSTTEPIDLAPFESLIVSLTEYDDTDLAVRWHIYDETQLPEALAHYDALAPKASGPSSSSFWADGLHRNHLDGGDEPFNAGDAAGYRSILRPDLRVYDFRTGHPQEYDREGLLASLGFDFDDAMLHKQGQLLGSRAPWLAIVEHELRGTWRGSGQVELGLLSVSEVDDEGKALRTALYEVGEVDAAFDTLDHWYVETRDPALAPDHVEYRRRYLARDWDGLAALFAADLVVEDHRLTGRELHRSRDEYFEHIRSMRDQLIESDIRCIHLIERPQGYLALNWNRGTIEVGGSGEATPFENRVVIVQEWDADGLVRRWDFYDEYQLPEAVARYEEFTR